MYTLRWLSTEFPADDPEKTGSIFKIYLINSYER